MQTRLCVLAAQFARALLHRSPSLAKRAQGRPGAGSHPRSAARKAHAVRTAQQHTGGADHSAFPARWLDGLCRDLPGADHSFWPPSPRELDDAVCPVGLARTFARLDRGNDGQDHTVLPYARPAISPQFSQPSRQSCETYRRDEPSSAARPHAGCGLTGTTRPARTISCRRCRVHRKPGSQSRRQRDRPSRMSRDGRHIRHFRISVKWNIFGEAH